MLARFWPRGAVRGVRGVRPAGSQVRWPELSGALALRIASSFIAIPLLLGIAYLGEPVYGGFIAAACAYAAWELRGMLHAGGYVPHDVALFGTAVLLPLDAWLRPGSDALARDGLLLIVVLVIVSLVQMVVRPRSDRDLVGWSLSLGLALYIGGLMQFYMPLREQPSSFPGFWVIALLLLSWACDTSAFFVGRSFGRTRLAPTISPKKSVEGAIAGLLGSAVAGLLIALLVGLPVLLMVGYGIAIAVATISGDLVESLIKRHMGVKDSGGLMPGHGGLLDRMDSLIFCVPIAVLYLRTFAV